MAINQCVINEGTDDELLCRAYRETFIRKVCFYFLVICTLGLVVLIFYWKPEWKVWVRAEPCNPGDLATHLIVRDKYQQNHVKTIKPLEQTAYPNFEHLDRTKPEKNEADRKHQSTLKQYFALSDMKTGILSNRYFEHKFNKYLWSQDTFLPLRGLDCDITVHQMRGMSDGLDEKDKADRQLLFGKNSITVDITPLIIVLFREILNPYYAFQLFAIVVWCTEEYYSLPAAMILLSGISISLSLYLTRKQDRMIHNMSAGGGKVRVLVNGVFESRDSTDLLPGDVIEISKDTDDSVLWCDCVLLSGNCVVSESMLTGESVPVLKTPLISTQEDLQDDFYDSSRHKQHTLYGGTKVVDIPQSEDSDRPRALVIRTGFYTEKGKMIESMLSPSPMDYKFYNDSLKFILVMAIIGVIGSILTVSFLAALQAEAGHIVQRVLDLITIVVPPGLPAALTIATIFAQRRLKNAKIFCISPPRIAISGKINCMCFDKTGTLTEDDLKLWGVLPSKDSSDGDESTFHNIVHEYQSLPQYGKNGTECLNALASCHSLVTVDGELAGDPIDLELFRATKWKLRKSDAEWSEGCSCVVSSDDNNVVELAMARVFQFNSVLRRMSVVTIKEGQDDIKVYVKGAPETIVEQCNKSTVPSDFDKTMTFYTKQGYRVLALAVRELDKDHEDLLKLERKFVESDLNFLGLVVMTNPLKPKTTETINKLKTANIRTVMATGDNLETAVFVAKKCNMVSSADKIVVVEASEHPSTGDVKLSWNLDSTEMSIENGSESDHRRSNHVQMENGLSTTYHFATTGKTLELIRQHSKTLFYHILTSATILARVKPDHKRHLVEGLQDMKYIVGMCGDGANDCGALKAAHSGIAIIDVKASIVAPFTSLDKDISCCIKLIREGRAALVTSFGMIKYLCVYCFIQYLSLIILYTINSYLSDIQFLFTDIGVTGIVTLFFAFGGAAKTLSKRQPHASLVSPVMLMCLLLQIALLVLFQAAAYVALQGRPWFVPLTINMTDAKQNIECSENTVVFYSACFQNMMLAFIFYKGLPHRQPLYKNVPYFVGFLVLSIWVIVMFFAPVEPIAGFFSLQTLNNDIGFKFILFALYVCNIIFAILIEKVLLESESFRRALKKISYKLYGIRRRKVDVDDNDIDVTYSKLRKQLSLDGSWPPIGKETTIKA